MMGGFGSGRPRSHIGIVESFFAIDANRLHRMGYLRPGGQPSLKWTCHGQEIGSIRLVVEGDRLSLSYRISIDGSNWENVSERVCIVRVACRFGGERPYFICPGTACGRRVATLYFVERYFLCRDCSRLGYSSQREDVWDRKRRRVAKAKQRLGGEPDADMDDSFPPKPKGMWWRTYASLCERLSEAEVAEGQAMIDL
jgi:hypothetical protein